MLRNMDKVQIIFSQRVWRATTRGAHREIGVEELFEEAQRLTIAFCREGRVAKHNAKIGKFKSVPDRKASRLEERTRPQQLEHEQLVRRLDGCS